MPGLRFSTLFLLLLSGVDVETKEAIWDCPDVLAKFGITCRPSTNSDDPAPAGLDKEKAQHIRIFTDSIANRKPGERGDWINNGQECAAGREFWQSWFSNGKGKGLAVHVNKIIDQALMDCGVYPGQQVDEERPDEFPSSDAAARDQASEIAGILIGDFKFMKDGRTMRPDVRDCVSSIVRLAYERLKKKWNTSKKTLAPRRKAADEIMAQIEASESVTTTLIRQAISKVASYKNAATLRFGEHERIEVYEASLQALMEKMGKRTAERRQAALSQDGEARVTFARVRMSKKNVIKADVSSEDDIQRTWSLFLDEFVVAPSQSEPLAEHPNEAAVKQWEDGLGDCGVSKYRKTSEEELSRLLGFLNGRPRSWSRYRALDVSINAWDSPNLEIFRGLRHDSDPDLPIPLNVQPVILLWHQLVGIASMADKSFSDEPGLNVPGIILSDGVGVGKSAQIMGFIAFLQNVWLSEQPDSQVSRPPLVEGRRYFMGQEGVPNLPHLVIVPNSLLDQWRREWKTFASPFSLDIFEYPTTTDADFFDSPKWAKESVTQNIFRVILMPQSAWHTMSTKTYDTGRSGRKGFPIDCQREVRNRREFNRNALSREFTSLFWDEGQDVRTGNAKWVGLIQMRHKARFICCATATPLYHSPKDVIYIGRVVSLPSFTLEKGAELEREGDRILKEKSLLSLDDREAMNAATEARLRGDDTSGMFDPMAAIKEKSIKYVQKIQRGLDDRMIRRTIDSRKPDGTKINDKLPPCHRYVFPICLPEFEMNQLRGEIDSMHDGETPSSSYFEYNNEAFYGPFRTLIGYPYPTEYLDDAGKTKRRWPVFSTKEEYDAKPGAKLSAAISLVKTLLLDDDQGPFVLDENDQAVFPPPSETPKRTRKILIYHEYAMMAETIVSAFHVNGIHIFAINGTHSPEERDRKVQEFIASTDPHRRVLLFSKVGACGLNLTCADAMLLYDIVWSDVEGVQIVGRIHRLGQEKPCHVYPMIAFGTTDVNMSSTAKFKDDMLTALVTRADHKKTGDQRKKGDESEKKMKAMLEGNMCKDGDDEDAVIDVEEEPKKGRRGRKKVVNQEDTGSEKKKRGRKRKAGGSSDEAGEEAKSSKKAKGMEDTAGGAAGTKDEILDHKEDETAENTPGSQIPIPPAPPAIAQPKGTPDTAENQDSIGGSEKKDSPVEPSQPPEVTVAGGESVARVPTPSEDDERSGGAHLTDARLAASSCPEPPPPYSPANPPTPSHTNATPPLPGYSSTQPQSLLSTPGNPSGEDTHPDVSRPCAPSDVEMKDISTEDKSPGIGAPTDDVRMGSPPPPPPASSPKNNGDSDSFRADIEAFTDDLLNFEVSESPEKAKRNNAPSQLLSPPRTRRTLNKDIVITPLSPRPVGNKTFGSSGPSRTIKLANARVNRRRQQLFDSESEAEEGAAELPSICVAPAVGVRAGGSSKESLKVEVVVENPKATRTYKGRMKGKAAGKDGGGA